jgi:hypothetical protein
LIGDRLERNAVDNRAVEDANPARAEAFERLGPCAAERARASPRTVTPSALMNPDRQHFQQSE